MENPSFNDFGGTFIFFSNPQIQKALRCNQDTARKVLNELEEYGLIHKEYQKTGFPLKIYVNDFFHLLDKTQKVQKEQVYRPALNTKPSFTEKEVSFDIERAEKLANDGTLDFGNMKIKKRRKY